jgi:Domain of unknown function (DUF4407)
LADENTNGWRDNTRPLDTEYPAATNGDGPGPFRPAPRRGFSYNARPSLAPARWLRVLTGVDEDLLDRAKEERSRYTGLGAIILGTAVMATLSMLDALDQIFGPRWALLVLVALFWGAFVCAIDRWLIASTHGMRKRLWLVFLPRIVLAILFGVIIATPLVLTVFDSEVVSRAQNDQNNTLLAYESKLKTCNPLPGQPQGPVQSADCTGYLVAVNNPALGLDRTIALEKTQRDDLTSTIATDNTTIASDNLIAREECNGQRGAGLSGIVGQGPNCTRDRQTADNFTAQSHVTQLETQLAGLNQQIAAQTVTAGQQTQAYASAISDGINTFIADKKAARGRIGLLARIDALGELASDSAVIASATVLLALFIITIDCLPVLSKMMSGTNRYDKFVEWRLRSAETCTEAEIKASERQSTGRDEIELERIDSWVRTQRERIDDDSRIERAKRDAELDRQIAILAAQYRRNAETEAGEDTAG